MDPTRSTSTPSTPTHRSSIPQPSRSATRKPASTRSPAASAATASRRAPPTYDREARFPFENYADLREAGLLGLCIPKATAASAPTTAPITLAAEIGRCCGADRAHLQHARLLDCCGPACWPTISPWPPTSAREHERRRALHYQRVVAEGAIYAQPFSEGGAAAAARRRRSAPRRARSRAAGGSTAANFRLAAGAADYYGVLCTEDRPDEPPSRRDTLYLAVPADAPGLEIFGDWDPLGMRGTVSRTLAVQGCLRRRRRACLCRAASTSRRRSRWPHMFMTPVPDVSGHRPGGLRLHRPLPARRGRRAAAGDKRRHVPDQAARGGGDAHQARADEGAFSCATSEARVDPPKDSCLRCYAAQYTVMENANDTAALACAPAAAARC